MTPTATEVGPTPFAVQPLPAVSTLALSEATELYRGPGIEFRFASTVPAGTEVEVVGLSENELWYQVRIDGATFWISSEDIGAAQFDTDDMAPASVTPMPTMTNTPDN
jgi:uncharacterized protein YgiM (DUF1202 family)